MLGFTLIHILAMVSLGSLTWWACSRMEYFKPKKCTKYDSPRDVYYSKVKESLTPSISGELESVETDQFFSIKWNGKGEVIDIDFIQL